jgi:hypothetical protein
MLNVLCLRVGHVYPVEYVYRLKEMTTECLKEKHRFICLTDNVSKLPGIDCIAAPIQLSNKWARVGLFAPLHRLIEIGDRCLYFDLDIVITGNLDRLIKGKLKRGVDSDGIVIPSKELWIAKGQQSGFCPSVMYWEHPQKSRIFAQFQRHRLETMKGDKELIEELMPDAKIFTAEAQEKKRGRKSLKSKCVISKPGYENIYVTD